MKTPFGKEILFVMQLAGMFVFGGVQMSKAESDSAPEVVSRVEIDRYMGTWYEIARYPNRFQKNCLSSTATYKLREDGKIEVINQCSSKKNPGETKTAHGKAWVVDPVSNAKLKVSFFWPFRGDYWIICLAPDYSYAVVGHPERKYLWLLSREPVLQRDTYQSIISKIVEQGYNPDRLIISPAQKGILSDGH